MHEKRAQAYELVKNWNAALSDWRSTVAEGSLPPHKLAHFARRLMAANEIELAASLFDEILMSLDTMMSSDPKNQEADSLRKQIQLDQVTLRERQTSDSTH